MHRKVWCFVRWRLALLMYQCIRIVCLHLHDLHFLHNSFLPLKRVMNIFAWLYLINSILVWVNCVLAPRIGIHEQSSIVRTSRELEDGSIFQLRNIAVDCSAKLISEYLMSINTPESWHTLKFTYLHSLLIWLISMTKNKQQRHVNE